MQTYNKKKFLAPDSASSMAAYHTKIYDDGIAVLRISDCNHTIKIWNDFTIPEQVLEMHKKMLALSDGIIEYADFIYNNYILTLPCILDSTTEPNLKEDWGCVYHACMSNDCQKPHMIGNGYDEDMGICEEE